MKQKRFPSLTRTLLFCALGVILLCLIYFCFEGFILDYINRPNHQAGYLSTSGYADALGVDRFSYDAFIKAYGEPDSTQRWVDPEFSDRELLSLSYGDFDVLYLVNIILNGETNLTFLHVAIKTERIHLGRFNIHIGSSRAFVRLSYLLDKKLSPEEIKYESHDFPDVEEGFYGDDWWRVLFSYDTAGKVDAITYAISPN